MDDKKWGELVNVVKKSFKLSGKKAKAVAASKTARFLSDIPYKAGCRNADRKALHNLTGFVMSINGAEKFAEPNKDDDVDILERLDLFGSFSDGDKDVIKKSLAQVAMAMLEDYKTDQEIDKAAGKYNPLNAGTMDYEKEKKKLEEITGAGAESERALMAATYGGGAFWSY